MNKKIIGFLILISILGISAGVTHYSLLNHQHIHYILKPLTTFVIILLAFYLYHQTEDRSYAKRIILGLLAGILGDTLLMLSHEWGELFFLLGMASFIINQLFYSLALSKGIKYSIHDLLFALPVVIVASVIYSILFPHLNRLSIPVLIYVLAISFMCWRAMVRVSKKDFVLFYKVSILLGSWLFLISDSILALDKFCCAMPGSKLISLSIYYAAQTFFALSFLKGNRNIKP